MKKIFFERFRLIYTPPIPFVSLDVLSENALGMFAHYKYFFFFLKFKIFFYIFIFFL